MDKHVNVQLLFFSHLKNLVMIWHLSLSLKLQSVYEVTIPICYDTVENFGPVPRLKILNGLRSALR